MVLRNSSIGVAILAAAVAGCGAYAFAGWLGVGLLGLLATFIAYQVQFDEAAPIGSPQTTGLYVATLRERDRMTRSEKAALRAEAASAAKILTVVKICGAVLAAVGGGGFCLVQLPR